MLKQRGEENMKDSLKEKTRRLPDGVKGARKITNIYLHREETDSVSPTETWTRRDEPTAHVSTITPTQRQKQGHCNDDNRFAKPETGKSYR